MRLATCKYAGRKRECIADFSGYWFVASAGHRVLVWDDTARAWRWRRMCDLRKTDYVPFNRACRKGGHRMIGPDLAWLLGVVIGDGYLGDPVPGVRGAMLSIACGHDVAFAKACTRIMRRMVWFESAKCKQQRDGQYLVVCYTKASVEWLRGYLCDGTRVMSKGHDVLLKRVPKWIYTAWSSSRCACFAGLLDSDGSIDADLRHVSYCTKHELLARDVQRLAATLGCRSAIVCKQRSGGFTAIVPTYYTVVFNMFDLAKLKLPLKSDKRKHWHRRAFHDYGSLPPNYARMLFERWRDAREFHFRSSYKKRTRLEHLLVKIRTGRGCSLGTARHLFKFPRDWAFLKFTSSRRGRVVPMWDASVLHSDKRIVTNNLVTHNSDLLLELIAPEGREGSFRVLKILKGRNTSYAEFPINFKLSPRVDFSEMYDHEYAQVSGGGVEVDVGNAGGSDDDGS